MMPKIAVITPTYLRPRLLENCIACFQRQDYPRDKYFHIVLDDAGQYEPQEGEGYILLSTDRRFPSLPEKFNALLQMTSGYDIVVIAEDDDFYATHHLAVCSQMLAHGKHWAKPSKVWSTYPGHPVIENASGRFHASMAFAREWFIDLGGWVESRRGDFDQQLIQKLTAIEEPFDPCILGNPSYVFRWGSTGDYHGQSFMNSPADEGWYSRCRQNEFKYIERINPQLDAESDYLIRAIKQ